MITRRIERSVLEDEQDKSEPSHKDAMSDVFDQMRANKAAPADPAVEAARRKVARMERAGATIAELTALSQEAGKGDRQAKERIVQLLDGNQQLCSEMADVSRCAEALILEAISDGNFAYQLALVRRAAAMRQEMLATHTSPLERTAAEHVLSSWWRLQYVDARVAFAAQRGARLGALLKMQERVAKGYQGALKLLELASKASQALSRSSSTAATTPIATAATKAKAGKVRVRSMPAKRKPVAIVAEMPPAECGGSNSARHFSRRCRRMAGILTR